MLQYWVCPKCGCMTQTDRKFCDNCNYQIEVYLMMEAVGMKPLKLTFQDTTERDSWLKLVKGMGMKVWRK